MTWNINEKMELLTDLKGDFLLTTAWGSARKCSCVSSKLFPFFVMVITGNPICRVHVSITDVISSPVTFKDLPWRKRKTQLRISNIHSRVLYVKDREKKCINFQKLTNMPSEVSLLFGLSYLVKCFPQILYSCSFIFIVFQIFL